MKIPSVLEDRERFYQDLIDKCLISREDRRSDYQNWRSWYLFGNGPEDQQAQFNKIYSHLDQITSFIYSAETTRFSIQLGAAANKKIEIPKTAILTRLLNDRWHDSETDQTFAVAVTWALSYATALIKVIPRGREFMPYIVEPEFFGVLDERRPSGTKQEAFVHIFHIPKSELMRRLYNHPGRERIVERLSFQQRQTSEVPEAVDRILLSAASPTMQGVVNLDMVGTNRMHARIAEETVECRELYVWNDEFNDYQVATMGEPSSVCIFDRLQGGDENDKTNEAMFLKGESPFIQVCPNPMPDYWWGMSEVQRLIPLQQLRNNRMNEILELLKRQVEPPTALMGFTGIQDEKNFALNRAGGLLSTDMPSAKVERLAPEIPEDLFREITEIDRMFSEASGIENVVAGRGEQGVRSAGHAAQLARLGSSRAKKRALVIEDNLESLATVYVKLLRERDDTHYETESGMNFIPKQFTDDFIVKVDAHSNSPIFMEDLRSMLFNLYKAGAISKELLVKGLQPPMEQEILEFIKQLPPEMQFAQPPQGKKPGGEGGGGATPLQAIQGGRGNA